MLVIYGPHFALWQTSHGYLHREDRQDSWRIQTFTPQCSSNADRDINKTAADISCQQYHQTNGCLKTFLVLHGSTYSLEAVIDTDTHITPSLFPSTNSLLNLEIFIAVWDEQILRLSCNKMSHITPRWRQGQSRSADWVVLWPLVIAELCVCVNAPPWVHVSLHASLLTFLFELIGCWGYWYACLKCGYVPSWLACRLAAISFVNLNVK